MITNKNQSHYVYIKDFDRFMCNKTKRKSKKHFCRYCLQCFSGERLLKINGKQIVKLRNGSIKFKKLFKTISSTI